MYTNVATVNEKAKYNIRMFRGYKVKHKTAKEILLTLGFDGNVNRGYVLLRKKKGTNIPCQMHALVNVDVDRTEYIDIHADFMVEGKHKTVRGRRADRWKQIFEQIDLDQPCDAGYKLLAHYKGLKEALDIYHEERERREAKTM
jgi:hypothetical protein